MPRRHNPYAGFDFLIAILNICAIPARLRRKAQQIDSAAAFDQARVRKLEQDIITAHDRRALIQEQVRTQSARTNLVENQGVLTDLKIEEKRHDLGINDHPFKPDNY